MSNDCVLSIHYVRHIMTTSEERTGEQGGRDSHIDASRDSEFDLSAIPINKIFTLIFIHDKNKDQVQNLAC